MNYQHTTITIDNRCLDLLLTDEEIAVLYARTLEPQNIHMIDLNTCCKCWPKEKPKDCTFWRKILGVCEKACDCDKPKKEEKCNG